MLYRILRPLLFRLDPESAHALALKSVGAMGAVPGLRRLVTAAVRAPRGRPVEAFGLHFPNRVGLAAGYDKDGEGWRGLAALGFGHIEVGTVTPRAQPGNPRPRLFRLPGQRSLINRLGFPGRGAAYVAGRLQGPRPPGLVLGVNIGKQRTTPIEEAARDYEELVDVFAPLADYLAVNVSSPNTPGLRRLQGRGFLEGLLTAVVARRDRCAAISGRGVPVLVKLAPDLDEEQLAAAADAILGANVDGVVATNTTTSREGVDDPRGVEEGGLSGAALGQRATRVVAAVHELIGGALPIIGVGGVMGPADAAEKLAAGATLVQVYTGLVYEGPALVGRILRRIG